MTPIDRKNRVEQIRERLREGKTCRVVSTSLIEAGVDVDFPEVMREEAGLDSILQAAGRCNREGKRDPDRSVVTVFRPETPAPAIFGMNIAAERCALRASGDRYNDTAVRTYFDELFALKGNEALDREQILRSLTEEWAFRSVSERFRLIGNETTTVYIPIGEGAVLVEKLRAGRMSRSLFRKLALNGVNLYPRHFRMLQEAGAILPVGEENWYLADLSLYDPEMGLSLTAESGNALFI